MTRREGQAGQQVKKQDKLMWQGHRTRDPPLMFLTGAVSKKRKKEKGQTRKKKRQQRQVWNGASQNNTQGDVASCGSNTVRALGNVPMSTGCQSGVDKEVTARGGDSEVAADNKKRC